MIGRFNLSERRACRLVGLTRDSYRHPPQIDPETAALGAAIIDIAQVRRRFGYRRIHDLLRPESPEVNHKRVYRLYSAANLAVRKRRKAKRPTNERVPLRKLPRQVDSSKLEFVRRASARGNALAAGFPTHRAV